MKFCFLGNVSDALNGRTPGGGELQIALLAKSLALKGHEVVIVDPFTKTDFTTTEGIKVIRVPDWNRGFKGFRFFKYRVPSLNKLLVEQNADYYYVRMRFYMNLLPYLAAKKTKKKLIVGIAHDLDVLSFWKKFKYEYKPKFNLIEFLTLFVPNDLVFKYLLKRSDFVTIQHSDQKLTNVKGKVCIYPNIFDQSNIPVIKDPSRDYFVHVGSLTILKGAGNLYELIKKIDKKNKLVIIGLPKDRKSRKIYGQLNKFENVVLKGAQSHSETIRLIANAKALISTSNSEGFPNIFLEAWATGVPVISLKVNPGNVIKKYNLGIYCDDDLEKMKLSIENYEPDTFNRNKLKSYVTEFHDSKTAADRFLNILSY